MLDNTSQEIASRQSAIKDNILKSFNSDEENTLEKGKKDIYKLEKKVITNKAGHQQTVYVRHNTDTGAQHEFKSGDTVKFEHKGKNIVGTIKNLKHHEIYDKFGTAVIHDKQGDQLFEYNKSLRSIEHAGEGDKSESKEILADKVKAGIDKQIGEDKTRSDAKSKFNIDEIDSFNQLYSQCYDSNLLSKLSVEDLKKLPKKIDEFEKQRRKSSDEAIAMIARDAAKSKSGHLSMIGGGFGSMERGMYTKLRNKVQKYIGLKEGSDIKNKIAGDCKITKNNNGTYAYHVKVKGSGSENGVYSYNTNGKDSNMEDEETVRQVHENIKEDGGYTRKNVYDYLKALREVSGGDLRFTEGNIEEDKNTEKSVKEIDYPVGTEVYYPDQPDRLRGTIVESMKISVKLKLPTGRIETVEKRNIGNEIKLPSENEDKLAPRKAILDQLDTEYLQAKSDLDSLPKHGSANIFEKQAISKAVTKMGSTETKAEKEIYNNEQIRSILSELKIKASSTDTTAVRGYHSHGDGFKLTGNSLTIHGGESNKKFNELLEKLEKNNFMLSYEKPEHSSFAGSTRSTFRLKPNEELKQYWDKLKESRKS